MVEVKAFNEWKTEEIEVQDEGIDDYVNLEPRIVPQTGARYAGQRFHKSEDVFVVERFINKLMVPGHKGGDHYRSSGHCTGKKDKVSKAVKEAFEIIEDEVDRNPVEVFVIALENAAPREEIVTIEYGGARYPKAVDVAPQRRIDLALRYMSRGAYHDRSFRSKQSLPEAIAEEVLEAYHGSDDSNAIKKKRDMERQASSAK